MPLTEMTVCVECKKRHCEPGCSHYREPMAAELARLRAELDAMTRRAELAEGYAQPYHDEAARLRAKLNRARTLIAAAVFNDFSDMASDGVTVGAVWQKDALTFLDALDQEPPARRLEPGEEAALVTARNASMRFVDEEPPA